MTPTDDLRSNPLSMALAVVIGVALIGFVVGIRAPEEGGAGPISDAEESEASSSGHPPAKSYTELRTDPPGDDDWWAAAMVRLDAGSPGLGDPVVLDPNKSSALTSRAAHRAYDGAPPTIPHPIRQDSASECLACHERGLRIGTRLAPPVSHTAYTSCTQCHVVESAPMPGGDDLPDNTVSNSFVGLASPSAGARAWDIAPPTIPHTTHMRETCMSCHGTNGRDPLRTPHPDRSSCTQCHAPSAELDQRPSLSAPLGAKPAIPGVYSSE